MPLDGAQLNPTAQHLINAKIFLQERGWCPDGAFGEGGTVCIAAAIGETCGRAGCGRALSVMSRTIGVELYSDIAIGRWNDTPGRTIEEVLNAFDRAIALAMEEGNAS